MIKFLETKDDYENESKIHYKSYEIDLQQTLSYYPFDMKLTKKESSKFIWMKSRISNLQKKWILPSSHVDWFFLEASKWGGKYIRLLTNEWQQHFVKFRCINTGQVQDFENNNIDIVLLSCLFNVDGIISHNHDNTTSLLTSWKKQHWSKAKEITWTEHITHYELESLYRQLSYINRVSQGETPYNKLHLQFPRIQYYIYAIVKLEEGYFNFDQTKQIFDIIDERVSLLFNLYAQRTSLGVTLDIPMESLKEYFIQSIKNKKNPALEEAITLLSQDKLWSLVLQIEKPSNRYELSWLLSEAVWELRHSFEKNWQLSIIIKNPKEEKSFTLAKTLASEIKKQYGYDFHLIGMYPHEQIVLNHTQNLDRKKMYQVRQKPTYSNAKEIIKHYSFQK